MNFDLTDDSIPAWSGQIVIESGRKKGRRITLPGTNRCITVGRDPQCDLVFDEGNERFVSRRHLQVDVREDGIFLSDLHSYTGTFVNGVALQGSVQLGPMTRVQIGEGGPLLAIFVSPPISSHGTSQAEKTAVLRPPRAAGGREGAMGRRLRSRGNSRRGGTSNLGPGAGNSSAPRIVGDRSERAHETRLRSPGGDSTMVLKRSERPRHPPQNRVRRPTNSPRPSSKPKGAPTSLMWTAQEPSPPPRAPHAEARTQIGRKPVGRAPAQHPNEGGDWFDNSGAPWQGQRRRPTKEAETVRVQLDHTGRPIARPGNMGSEGAWAPDANVIGAANPTQLTEPFGAPKPIPQTEPATHQSIDRPRRGGSEVTMVEGRLSDLQASTLPLQSWSPNETAPQPEAKTKLVYQDHSLPSKGSDEQRAARRRSRRQHREAEETQEKEQDLEDVIAPSGGIHRALFLQAAAHIGVFLGVGILGVLIAGF